MEQEIRNYAAIAFGTMTFIVGYLIWFFTKSGHGLIFIGLGLIVVIAGLGEGLFRRYKENRTLGAKDIVEIFEGITSHIYILIFRELKWATIFFVILVIVVIFGLVTGLLH